MKEILLLGLQSTTNLGDRLVYQCTDSIIKEIIGIQYQDAVRTVSCDMLGKPYYKYIKELPAKETERKIRIEVERELKEKYPSYEEIKEMKRRKRFPRYYAKHDARPKVIAAKKAEAEERKKAEMLAEEQHDIFLKEERKKITISSAVKTAEKYITANTAAVIFVGGGLIKYGHPLCLGEVISAYTAQADRLGIPVMFSAVGIEGYDENAEECAVIRTAVNRACVKAVSVRDDMETFRKHYLTNPDITVQKVPCPTCLTKYFFPMGTLTLPKTIGLGMGKAEWFFNRNPNISEEEFYTVWAKIIQELEQRGYDWKIFCNGMGTDLSVGKKLLKFIGKSNLSDEKLLPAPKSLHQLLDSYLLFEGIIGSRLHTAIPAYSYGIPIVELVWNDKQRFFGEYANISDRFFELQEADPVRIVDQLEAAMKNGYPDNEMDTDRTVQALKDFLESQVFPRLAVKSDTAEVLT